MENNLTDTTELTAKLVKWFEDAEQSTMDARKFAERDRDYYDNKQWTSEELEALSKRGQPPITINRIKRKVDTLRGIEKQQRSDPKAFPRNPGDEESAQAATEALRFVSENNNYDQIRSNYWENLIVEGIGAVKVSIKEGKRGVEILLSRVPWDRFFYDPHSNEADFSDAKFMGEVIWMDLADAKRKWRGSDAIISATMDDGTATNSDTYDDKPKFNLWADGKRNRVRIVQIRWSDVDGWRITTFTKGGILKDDVSPYLDEDGKPENDMVAASAFVDRDNDRYGAVREMISPQDEINKRRSKALHLITMRQVRIDPRSEAFQNQEDIRAELAKPDGVVVASKDDLEILQTGDMAASQFALLQEAKSEIDIMGPSPSLQGKEQRDLSGKALQTLQQGGLVELAPLLDRKRDMDIRVYRMIWNRIKQFWTDARWIRITENQDNPKFVGLNQPLTNRQHLEKSGIDLTDLEGQPELEEFATLGGEPVIDNNIGEMDIDIILDEGPDSITMQSEQFEQLVQMASIVPIPPDVIIEASSLQNKKVLLDMIRGTGEDVDPEQVEQEQQMQQAAIKLEFDAKQADIDKTNAEAKDKESHVLVNLANAKKTV